MLQIQKINWKISGEKKERDFIPYLSLYNQDEKSRQNIILSEYSFNWKLSVEKYCIGYRDLDSVGGFHKCPINNILVSKTADQCAYCSKKEGFKDVVFYGKEPVNENIKRILDEGFLLYLAYFPGNIIKVGTAAVSKNHRRLLEQDALTYRFIAFGQGKRILKLEKEISKKLNLTENVRGNTKFKFISQKPNFEHANRQLSKAQSRIKSHFSNTEFKNELNQKTLQKNEVVIEFNKSYTFLDKDFVFYPKRLVSLQKSPEQLFGIYKGFRGRYLILENKERLYGFDVKELTGRIIKSYLDSWDYELDKDQTTFNI